MLKFVSKIIQIASLRFVKALGGIEDYTFDAVTFPKQRISASLRPGLVCHYARTSASLVQNLWIRALCGSQTKKKKQSVLNYRC